MTTPKPAPKPTPRYVVLPVGECINVFRAEASILGMGDRDVQELVTQIFEELMGAGVRPTPNKDMLIWRLSNEHETADWVRIVDLFQVMRMGIHAALNEQHMLPAAGESFSYCFAQFRIGSDVLVKHLSDSA